MAIQSNVQNHVKCMYALSFCHNIMQTISIEKLKLSMILKNKNIQFFVRVILFRHLEYVETNIYIPDHFPSPTPYHCQTDLQPPPQSRESQARRMTLFPRQGRQTNQYFQSSGMEGRTSKSKGFELNGWNTRLVSEFVRYVPILWGIRPTRQYYYSFLHGLQNQLVLASGWILRKGSDGKSARGGCWVYSEICRISM